MVGTNEIFKNRVYNTYPYLVLQQIVYNSNLKEDLSVKVNVFQNDNLFGDSNPLDLYLYDTIEFRLYDVNNNLIFRTNDVEKSNDDTSELKVIIDSFFVKQKGIYYGQFTLIGDDEKIILPKINDQIRVKIQYN